MVPSRVHPPPSSQTAEGAALIPRRDVVRLHGWGRLRVCGNSNRPGLYPGDEGDDSLRPYQRPLAQQQSGALTPRDTTGGSTRVADSGMV